MEGLVLGVGKRRREETNWDLGRERERTRKRREKAGMRWMFKQSSAKNSRDGWVKRPTHRLTDAYQCYILARLRLHNAKSTQKGTHSAPIQNSHPALPSPVADF
jgi:hypothetical protein